MFFILFLELQETRFDLRFSVLQRGGGQGGVDWQVGHGGRHLRDAAGQLLPGQQGGGRGAVPTRGGEVGPIHGGVVGCRDGARRQRGALTGVPALSVLRFRLHLQMRPEVEAKRTRWKPVYMLFNKAITSNVEGELFSDLLNTLTLT